MKGPIHIVVLGKEGVGKTALVVRFLTKRYLSEYAQTDEAIYERNVSVDERNTALRFTDISGKDVERRAANKEMISKMDGIIVVYSIIDRHSFDVAKNIISWLQRERRPAPPIPLLLLGNKCDLGHRRVVESPGLDSPDWQTDSDCFLRFECSACDDVDGVDEVFTKFIRKIQEKRDPSSKPPRKVNHHSSGLGSPTQLRAAIRRRFSVFNRDRTTF
ncbi:hypothetical protein LOTGIDRAFT_151908 [Lottia gigantea]|uniref:small monomeric GTPase n=1 Tax=Lottia gigantea TaxID=225164 RepID=V4BGT1_LOTGI|nr:hypothetical protein LOTGIDRAFT_151908 [Lottia gigantea]ESP05112.1 hypothetical protein LOTGIDRAFT_151908 [Lottia gigantea]